jgi:hypothetical protein
MQPSSSLVQSGKGKSVNKRPGNSGEMRQLRGEAIKRALAKPEARRPQE